MERNSDNRPKPSALIMSTIAITLFLSACGQTPNSDLKIIGGVKVSANDPLATRVSALVSNKNEIRCTVAAISPSVFITAAHCVYGRNLEGWTIQSGITLDGETLPVASATVHSEFSLPILYSSLEPDHAPNDIAVIQTSEPTQGTIPVPILRKRPGDQAETSRNIIIAGFGRTDGASPESVGTLEETTVVITKFNKYAHEFTTQDADGKMGCHGDSGGPAFEKIGKTLTLIGTVSRGDNSCKSGTTVFTDLSEFGDFLSTFAEEIDLDNQKR